MLRGGMDELILHDIVCDLIGTCKSLEDVLLSYSIDYDDLTEEDHRILDSKIAECTTCQWWIDVEEIHYVDGEIQCAQCNE